MSKADNSKSDKKKAAPERIPNAWVISTAEALKDFSLTLKVASKYTKGIHDGDGVIIVSTENGARKVTLFAQVFRIRREVDSMTFYFDTCEQVDPAIDPAVLGLTISPATFDRIDWPVFTEAFKKAFGKEVESMTPIGDQSYLRRLLQMAVMDDLLGPANGPFEEVVGMSVRDRYLVGKLAPKETYNGEEEEEELGVEGEDDSEKETPAAKSQTLAPSSFGFTFCLDGDAKEIELEVLWGRYDRGDSETAINPKTGNPAKAWLRLPTGGKQRLTLKEGPIERLVIDPTSPEVFMRGMVRPRLPKGDRLVTLFIVNDQTKPDENQDAAWVFQPEIIVRGLEGAPVFRRRPVMDADGNDPEREALEMVYRKRVEFAVGHGVSVHAEAVSGDTDKATEVRTVVMPEYELQVTETPGSNESDRPAMRKLVDDGLLDMEKLSSLNKDELAAALNLLVQDYDAWIKEQTTRISGELKEYESAATEAMARCVEISSRLKQGIQTLESNDNALESFRFANKAMALQRVRSIFALSRRRGKLATFEELNVVKNRSWRPFQLAFILLSVPALADPKHRDRTENLEGLADLLWFPTGGGKTEAYLGVAAFTMAIRRLQGNLGGYDSSRGLSVIMRYTLRLLTIQQFQRATTLLCAMETIRMADDDKWGGNPFSLGLWVGNKVTPGSTEQSHRAIEAARNEQRPTGPTPAQLTFCPWCGSEIREKRDITIFKEEGRTAIYCGDPLQNCEFSKGKRRTGLPVVVVDEEIYHRPPSMLIGTVDKFAMMAWRGETRTLFGRASKECPRHGLLWPEGECTGTHRAQGGLPSTATKSISPLRPPDLIIQDEFHLISGPLGTMVGLYETAVDELSSWKVDDVTVHPKVIASTATVRKAEEQVRHVFLRKVAVFPPHGLEIEDNFFSVQRPVTEKPGRLYLGICSPGSSRPAVLIRLYVALLTAAQNLYDKFGSAADPYMTLVGYFNSLRELGGMRRLAEDDVQTRSYRVEMSEVKRPGLKQRDVKMVDELTSRVSSKEIPLKLDQLEVQYKKNWDRGETKAMDIVLATNMLSVGVDVNRLGLMAVNGQPKSTAEYIQATSRVGRSFPGLVCTVLTWSRPRDLSHYETFEHYHATFYKHVEAQSVTPFAARAMDRGLTGILVSHLRLKNEPMNPNLGAGELKTIANVEATKAKDSISDRAWQVTNKRSVKIAAEGMLAERIDRWVKEATKAGRKLGYDEEPRKGDVVALLRKPGPQQWDECTAPMSMREVEPGVCLLLDPTKMTEGPRWKVPKKSPTKDKK